MKMSKVFLSGAFLASLVSATEARAESKHWTDLRECIDQVAKVTGKKYIYDRKVEGRNVGLSPNLEITAENADITITNLLLLNELSRVPNGSPDTYYIVESKNAIQSPVPVYEASLKKDAALPNTFDIVSVKYTMVDAQVAIELQRFLTDLIPRYGRITAYPNSSILLMTDTAQNLKRVIDVVKSLDKPMSAEFKAELQRHKAEMAARKKKESA